MDFSKKVEYMREGSRPIGENSVGYVLYTNADMEQNDPNHPDYVKNRPFYKETGTTITWDGEPTGVSITLQEGVVLHKVSDYIPQTLVDCELTGVITRSGETQEITYTLTAADVFTAGNIGDKPVIIASEYMVAVFPSAGTWNDIEVPEAGLYFQKVNTDASSGSVTKLVCGIYTKKLDPAFLPFRFYSSATDIASIDFTDWKPGEMAFLLGEEIPL